MGYKRNVVTLKLFFNKTKVWLNFMLEHQGAVINRGVSSVSPARKGNKFFAMHFIKMLILTFLPMTGQSVRESHKAVKLCISMLHFLLLLPFLFFSPPLARVGLDKYDASTYKTQRLTLACFLIHTGDYIHKNLCSPKRRLSESTNGVAMWLKLMFLGHRIGKAIGNWFQI